VKTFFKTIEDPPTITQVRVGGNFSIFLTFVIFGKTLLLFDSNISSIS